MIFVKYTGEFLYICVMCNESFTEQGNRKKHQHVHTRERSFTCEVCNRSFMERGNLKRHNVYTLGNFHISVICVTSHSLLRMLQRITWMFVVCSVCSSALSLTNSSLLRVTCESNILYVLGVIIASDTNTMNCTFFETLSVAGTDNVFIPICDATHTFCI